MSARDARVVDREDGSAGATPSPTTFGLRSTSKIRDRHLDRLAMVYVRQSSPQQVLENRESRERQYALAQFAQRLGWPAERVVIVDEDQGQSGKSADNRSGFQRLMTEVSLNHVGIVLGLELSRLSRSNKDWHQLIDVCGIFNTLLCDQDGVYDPLDSNDRLLLGMKGAMSEFELVTLRNRLLRGSRNKAERGELFLAVPLGYLKTSSGEVIQEPDEQARGMIRLVFEKFEELGSAYAVFRYLVVNDLQTGISPPARRPHRGAGVEARRRPIGSCRSCDTRSTPVPMLMDCIARGRRHPDDRTRRGRQVVRAARGVARAPPGSAARLHLLGSIHEKSGEAQAEPIAPGNSRRAETRRGAAARAGRVRQVRPSHGDPLQDGQEAQLLLRRALRGRP